ncbi:uncharacterized protein LOC100382225 isoform 1 [Zea mays]|uniref:Uncharacterized protein n=1 Tax=Zea mays TaxID=4577 RepID=C0P5L1_MAIZE|nr:uncharacterized protein LOC100382225 isoform 1 [Zea mays]ACN28277.1 unknown [Zea mays]|eukprot:NP_001168452.1 hypothetical protein [Zea mays]
MELGGGGRGGGDRVRRQLQSVGRLAAYLGGGFLLLSATSSVAVRALRAISDANQEVREAVRCLRGEGQLLVQALQGQRHHRVVSDARPGVRESVPLPYLRWDSGAALLELPGKWLRLKKRCQFSLSMIDGCWGVGKRVWNQLKLKGFCWDFVSRQKIAVSTQLKMRDNG